MKVTADSTIPNPNPTSREGHRQRWKPDPLPIPHGPLTPDEYSLLARGVAGRIRQGANRQQPWPVESIVAAACEELAGGLFKIQGQRERAGVRRGLRLVGGGR